MRGLRAHRIALLAAVALALALAPAAARAESTDDGAALLAASSEYFAGERAQGVAWGAVGAVGVATGALCLASDDAIARGAAYPLLAVGVIQLGAAAFSYISPPRRLRKAREAIAKDPAAYRRAEHARMKRVVLGFEILELTEISLVVVGAGLAIAGEREGSDTLVGVGGGIAFQALAMLALDGAAHDRANRYVERLAVSVDRSGARVGWSTSW